jgi:predicted ferric reductase
MHAPAASLPARHISLLLWPVGAALALGSAAWVSLPAAGQPPAALLVGLGRFLGLSALWLWAASLLMMLRPRALELACGGLNRLYYLHHACGTLAYLALLAHPLALAAGAGWQGPAAQAMLFDWAPGLVMGWVALLALMLMLGATFWLPLGYAHWRRIHMLAAPAFVLAGVHALWLAPGVAPVAFRVLSLLPLLGGCAALVLRYLIVAGRVDTHAYRVAEVSRAAPDVAEIALEPLAAPLHWRAGQFVFVAFFDGRRFHGCGEYHPYTVAGAEYPDGRLKLLVRALGDCTRNIQRIEPGVPARVQGPFGGFLASYDAARAQLWIAGGIGITPFIAAAETLPAAAEPVRLIHFARAADAGLCRDLIARAARQPALAQLAGGGAGALAEVVDLVSDGHGERAAH